VKRVFTAHDVTEAHLVRGLLESRGLTVAVHAEDLWGTRGEVPFIDAWPTVWVVDDAREAEARELVRQYESGGTEPASQMEAWRCPQCGQQLEPQFTSCWQCGAERPSGG
jgi:hypothetical protein